MGRRPVYIAGPYGARSPEEIERNVTRACLLGRLAALWGLAPLVPHAIGWSGCHGARDESVEGVREAALESGVALAALVGAGAGHLWVILTPFGLRSPGTLREVGAWRQQQGGGRLVERTWAAWKEDLHREGLEVTRG